MKCLPDAQIEIELQPRLAVVQHVEDGDLDDALLDQLRLRVASAKKEEQVVDERVIDPSNSFAHTFGSGCSEPFLASFANRFRMKPPPIKALVALVVVLAVGLLVTIYLLAAGRALKSRLTGEAAISPNSPS